MAAQDPLAYCEDAIPFTVPVSGKEGQKRNLVLVSCDPNRKQWNTVMGPLGDPDASQGGLWVVDPSPIGGGEPQVQKVRLDWPTLVVGRRGRLLSDDEYFHPLGIELIEPSVEGGNVRLVAVNHGPLQSTLEFFNLFPSPDPSSPLDYTAHHFATFFDRDVANAPNSIAVLPSNSPDTFRLFLSQDHKYNRRTENSFGKLANFVETAAALPLAEVDYVELHFPLSDPEGGKHGSEVVTVADKIAFANGLALSPDHKTLVVASTTRRELLFYSIDDPSASPPSLNLTRTVKVPMLVDNLSLLPSSSTDGDSITVLASGHPSYPALLSVAHSLKIALHLPPALANVLGLSHWPGLDFDWQKQRGMSWVVSVTHPAKEGAKEKVQVGAKGRVKRREEVEWETVFQSHGRTDRGGFGGSTTAVSGSSAEDGREWLVVAGLYEEGVKVIRERRRV